MATFFLGSLTRKTGTARQFEIIEKIREKSQFASVQIRQVYSALNCVNFFHIFNTRLRN
jgi:hypothetical protein